MQPFRQLNTTRHRSRTTAVVAAQQEREVGSAQQGVLMRRATTSCYIHACCWEPATSVMLMAATLLLGDTDSICQLDAFLSCIFVHHRARRHPAGGARTMMATWPSKASSR